VSPSPTGWKEPAGGRGREALNAPEGIQRATADQLWRMLRSGAGHERHTLRQFIWQHFTRLTPGEVLEAIPLFHPIWADADPDDIAFADQHAAHGNFRAGAQLTAHTRIALARTGRRRVDQELLRWAFSRLSGAA
jgi:hypothetical protein